MRRLLSAFALIAAVLCAAAPADAASSYTSCQRAENPVPGDPAVRNAWGTIENTGRSLLDAAISSTLSLSVAGAANVTLTASDGVADQSRSQHYVLTGILTGNISVFWPGYCRAFSVLNSTTGAFTLTVAVVGTPGTTVAVPQGSSMLLVSDGTNISQRIIGTIGGTTGALTLPVGPDTLVGRATTDTLTNKTFSAGILTGNTTLPGSGQISSAGLLGLGMTPSNTIDITQNSALSTARIKYSNSNTGGSPALELDSNTANVQMFVLGSTFGGTTYGGLGGGNQAVIEAQSASSFVISTNTTNPIVIAPNRVAVAQFAPAGLGLGMTPANMLDITQTQNASSVVSILNASAGTASSTQFSVNNGTNAGKLLQFGTSFTTAGVSRADGTMLRGDGTGGLTINTSVNQPIYVAVNGVEAARFTSGALLITGAGAATPLQVSASNASAMFYSGIASLVPAVGESATNSMLFVRKDTTTSRSISAAGTINASGADYAEWENLASGVARPSAGGLVGFDNAGAVTDDCTKSASFGLVSTDPSFVGGDKLTAGLKGDALKRRESRLIMVAYSGKATVNFKAGRPGEYIVARCEGKAIKASALTRAQMSISDQDNLIGRVRSVLPDGRREVALMH